MKKTVLVTGAAGFVGSRLSERLLNAGYGVIGLVREGGDLFRIKHILRRMRIVSFPKGSPGDLFRGRKVDGIVHLATYYRKRHVPEDVLPMLRTNIEMPAALLDAAVAHGVRWFVNTGTFFEYALPEKGRLREDSPLAPWNLYASTKAAFEEILRSYVRSSSIKGMTMRLFSPYGPEDNPEKVIPYLIASMLRGSPVSLSGSSQKLSFVHLDDIVDAYMLAIAEASSLTRYEVFNVGGAKSYDVLQVARVLESVSGKKLDLRLPAKVSRSSGPDFVADLKKAAKVLGWSPRRGIREGLELTYRAYQAKAGGR